MNLLHTNAVQRWASRHMCCRVEGVPDRYALTFDDGPSARNTPRLLELLSRLRARATFFVLAGHARRHPAIVRLAHEAGHEVGIHGETHVPPAMFTRGRLRAELEAAASAVVAACGARPRRYRPPFGMLLSNQAAHVRRQGYEPILGDVFPNDPHERDGAALAARALARIRPGSILILHDASVFGDASRAPTLEAVERIVSATTSRGLRAVPVAELVEASTGASRAPGR